MVPRPHQSGADILYGLVLFGFFLTLIFLYTQSFKIVKPKNRKNLATESDRSNAIYSIHLHRERVWLRTAHGAAALPDMKHYWVQLCTSRGGEHPHPQSWLHKHECRHVLKHLMKFIMAWN